MTTNKCPMLRGLLFESDKSSLVSAINVLKTHQPDLLQYF